MKMRLNILAILIVIASFPTQGIKAQQVAVTATTLSSCMQTQIVSLTATSPSSASYPLSTNQVVIIENASLSPNNYANANYVISISPFGIGNPISFTNPANDPGLQMSYPSTFTGLTNITISSTGAAEVTLKVLTPSTNAITYTPVNSVVIPSDATGPVNIILQSSSDMVNWVPSMPGTYGNTYSNRFFRVIAVAQ